jgi:hypothetical protein
LQELGVSLVFIAWISIAIAFVCALVIVADELRHPQSMSVMNIVWPVTALYLSLFALWAYFTLGRRHTKRSMREKALPKNHDAPPTAAQIALSASHCGAGCMIADVVTEFALAASGFVILGSVLWTEYLFDFIAAWALGIVFQYLAIKPMRDDLSRAAVFRAAMKADTFSILAFQVGMYAWMALVYFRLFTAPHLTPFDLRFWLMMQIAMICGLATTYPVNRLLIGLGVKEAM